MQVGDLDATEPVLLCQRDAPRELVARRAHATAQVIGIAQSAKRIRFRFRRTAGTCVGQRRFMLAQTIVGAADAEVEIAAQVMQARAFQMQAMAARQRLGFGERGQPLVDPFDDPHARRDADQGPASHGVIPRHRHHIPPCGDRFGRAAQIEQHAGLHRPQSDAIRLHHRQRQTTRDKHQGTFVAIARDLLLARREKRGRRTFVASEFVMLGRECGIACCKPFRSERVQQATPRLQQGFVGAVANQRMPEQIAISFRPQQILVEQDVAARL